MARSTGVPGYVGALIMGADLVAVDATCCRLMGLPAERVPTLAMGAYKKLGRINEADIPQIGEPIAKLAQAFEWPPKIEKLLMPVGEDGVKGSGSFRASRHGSTKAL